MRLLLIATVLSSGSLNAQSMRLAIASDSVPSSVAEAEQQGLQFAALVARRVMPPQFSETGVQGSSARLCMRVGEVPVVRAGDFLVGPFDERPRRWSFKKLWWVPASVPGELLIQAVHVAGKAPPRLFIQPGVAHPARGDTSYSFHPSRLELYEPGTWMLIARSGSSWGCILVEVE